LNQNLKLQNCIIYFVISNHLIIQFIFDLEKFIQWNFLIFSNHILKLIIQKLKRIQIIIFKFFSNQLKSMIMWNWSKKKETSGQIILPKSYWSERLRPNQTFKKIKLQFVKFYAFKVVFLEQKKVLQNILVINTMRTVTNVSMIISLVFYFR
jgi:hypothetical protein